MSTILVVDDEQEIRDLYRVLLQNEGYEVLAASDTPACMKLAAERTPDLILLDWMMPGVDGMDALRMLKKSPGSRQIPVIMVTALDGISEIRLATDNGADGYLTKPLDAGDLLAVVARYLRKE